MKPFSSFFDLRVNPFADTPNTQFFFGSRAHGAALESLVAMIARGQGFGLLTGPIGSGKTMLCRVLLKALREDVHTAVILHPVFNPDEVVAAVCEEFGVVCAEASSLKERFDALTDFLIEAASNGKRCLLMVDDAQRLSREALESIRLLGNLETEHEKLLQIVLIGQPELATLLKERNLEQLRQRIAVHVELSPLDRDETEAYIRHRLHKSGGFPLVRFHARACDRIHKATRGIPRLVNRLCENLIREAETRGQHLIDASFVKNSAWPGLRPVPVKSGSLFSFFRSKEASPPP